MATTLAQPSQPPRTITNLAITLTFKTPRTAPTPLRAPPPQGYVLKLPNTFLLQHGSKIRDGLLVLKLVRPNPNPHLSLAPSLHPHPNPNQVAGLGRCAGLPLNLSGMPYEVVSMARHACRGSGPACRLDAARPRGDNYVRACRDRPSTLLP